MCAVYCVCCVCMLCVCVCAWIICLQLFSLTEMWALHVAAKFEISYDLANDAVAAALSGGPDKNFTVSVCRAEKPSKGIKVKAENGVLFPFLTPKK